MIEPNSHITPMMSAAIHIGASSISLLVLGHHRDTQPKQIDFLQQSAPIANNVFSKGKLSRRCIERCVAILQGYFRSLDELGFDLSTSAVRLVATNIVSEASNKDIFLNRIRISCGIDIEILDDGEMTRLIYLKTRRRLRDMPSMKKRTSLVLHVGPGNTRAILFRNGKIENYSNYRLGTHRTSESIELAGNIEADSRKRIREHITAHLEPIKEDYQDAGLQDLILLGYEIQHIAPYLPKHSDSSTLSTTHTLTRLCSKVAALPIDDLVASYQLDYHTAGALLAALEINLAVAEHLHLETIHVPESNYELGLLQDLFISPSLSEEFSDEVIRSAESTAKKYRVMENHARHVANLCSDIFEQTREIHNLSDHDALLLQVAAILHECGGFISSRAHHKHSQYIIQNSEIFGLSQADIEIISLIARYHRNSEPKTNHSIYRDLSTEDRMRVSKLASIIRVADALDKTHSSRVKDLKVGISKRRLNLILDGITDANIERLAMRSKGNLFENIFGLEINIQEDQPA